MKTLAGLLLTLLFPTAAAPWEFTPFPMCTLSHTNNQAQVVITHDPSVPEYRLDLTVSGTGWKASPTFGIIFSGGRSLTIGTERHRINGSALSVSDVGFGNVLDGLEYNATATAFTASQEVQLSLAGAAPEVRKFRACAAQPPIVS